MDLDQKKALLDASLERAAEKLGDITPHVLALYYRRHPDAEHYFDSLISGGRARLEQQMVDQVLYCLMEWHASPTQIKIILLEAVPHHAEVLHVRPQLFSELIIAVCDTLIATIPARETAELAVWAELREALTSGVDHAARIALAS